MPGDAGPSRGAVDGPIAARPAVATAGLFAVGIALHRVVPHVPVVWMTGVAVALLVAWRWLGHPAVATGALTCGLASAGVAAGQLTAFYYPQRHVSAFATDDPRLSELEHHLDHAPRVLTSPFTPHHAMPPKQVVTASVTRVKTWQGWTPARGDVLVQISQPHPRLQENQTVRVLGMLQRPAPANNPGQFDWAGYYREQRVLASVHVPHAENIQILDSPGPTPVMWLREETRRLLAAGFAPSRSLDHALLRALLLGDHDPQLRDVQDQFQRTGTSHHLAISGMHVAVLGGLVYFVCRLLCLSPRVLPRSLAEKVATGLPHGQYMALPAPIMGAEDFSYVLEKVPGMMAFLGVAQSGADWQQCCGIHSSHMMVDESVMPRGTAFLAGCATRFLADGWD